MSAMASETSDVTTPRSSANVTSPALYTEKAASLARRVACDMTSAPGRSARRPSDLKMTDSHFSSRDAECRMTAPTLIRMAPKRRAAAILSGNQPAARIVCTLYTAASLTQRMLLPKAPSTPGMPSASGKPPMRFGRAGSSSRPGAGPQGRRGWRTGRRGDARFHSGETEL